MTTKAEIDDFVAAVASLSSKDAFNPYSDICMVADSKTSPHIRASNLRAVLEACVSAEKCSLWIGRDLGYRGGRRTGVALTDEVFLQDYGATVGARTLKKATVGPVMAERTACVVQNLLRQIKTSVFMWNVFPLHPYEGNNHLTNRRHTSAERDMARFAIDWLLSRLKIDVVVAIGRDAEAALADMKIKAVAARHPSYGGQRDFVNTMLSTYNVTSSELAQPLLL